MGGSLTLPLLISSSQGNVLALVLACVCKIYNNVHNICLLILLLQEVAVKCFYSSSDDVENQLPRVIKIVAEIIM